MNARRSDENIHRGRHKSKENDSKEDRPPDVVLKSLLSSMRASMSAHERSQSERRSLGSLLRTVLLLVFFVLLFFIGVFEIIVGAIGVGRCPVQPMIPVWLLISGLMNLFRNAFGVACTMKQNKTPRQTTIRDFGMGIFFFVWFVWLTLGSYWIYDVYNVVVYEHGEPNYCNQAVYSFAFVILTFAFVVLGILLCCVCYCAVFLCCHNSSVVIIS